MLASSCAVRLVELRGCMPLGPCYVPSAQVEVRLNPDASLVRLASGTGEWFEVAEEGNSLL